jgi:hypothetical protein
MQMQTPNNETQGSASARAALKRLPRRRCGRAANLVLVVMAGFLISGPWVGADAGSWAPYYRKNPPTPLKADGITPLTEFDFKRDPYFVDLENVSMPPYSDKPGDVSAYSRLFDGRAAAVVFRTTDHVRQLLKKTANTLAAESLLKRPTNTLEAESLSAMAYADYFPGTTGEPLRKIVNQAILAAFPGMAGTGGDYDMNLMHLVPLAYRFYDKLTPEAREHLITKLMARGMVSRMNLDTTFTSGGTPDDWSRAGLITVPVTIPPVHKNIGETENHILMILTARYLTNQLAYQRIQSQDFDNRRNGGPKNQTMDVILALLRNILRGDFSEYNAKNYQTETRWALLNLFTYAYDAEVRLAARMVLDYVSARFAVTSNDLRRMVPFRRRNEYPHVALLGEWYGPSNCPSQPVPQPPYKVPYKGVMDIGLLDWQLGADPLTRMFALQAGNTRAFEVPNGTLLPPNEKTCKIDKVRPWSWAIADDGAEIAVDALTDYRLPPSIHDLFVNDKHRRFFEKLHRSPHPDEVGGNRNCNHDEITAGSPSYLITAGGRPCDYAIDPRVAGIVFDPGDEKQQKGVAVTTSFMPTGASAGFPIQSARDLIQFSTFWDDPDDVENYGVAPDLAFGWPLYLPPWVTESATPAVRHGEGEFIFVNKRPPGDRARSEPGFYLAIYRENGLGLLEAFDTWLNWSVEFEQFKQHVLTSNRAMRLKDNVETVYTTYEGNRVQLVIWTHRKRDDIDRGAKVLRIDYHADHPSNGRLSTRRVTTGFLDGKVMNSPAEAVVEITNPFLGTKIVLDMSDAKNPKRTSETGEVEQAGANHEVWVDFDFNWPGPKEGDFYRPFNTLEAAVAAVADGGVIRIAPSSTKQAVSIRTSKRIKLVAPIGGVRVGVR